MSRGYFPSELVGIRREDRIEGVTALPVFAYQAVNREQGVVDGVVVADSARQARDQLRLQGLTVRKIDVQRAAGAWWRKWVWTGGSSARLTGTIRELSTLLSVGVPLVEALDVIQQQHTGAFQTSLLVLRDRLAGGASLAEAMTLILMSCCVDILCDPVTLSSCYAAPCTLSYLQ